MSTMSTFFPLPSPGIVFLSFFHLLLSFSFLLLLLFRLLLLLLFFFRSLLIFFFSIGAGIIIPALVYRVDNLVERRERQLGGAEAIFESRIQFRLFSSRGIKMFVVQPHRCSHRACLKRIRYCEPTRRRTSRIYHVFVVLTS